MFSNKTFNEAMALKPWRPFSPPRPWSVLLSFNEAMTQEPWRPERPGRTAEEGGGVFISQVADTLHATPPDPEGDEGIKLLV